MNSSQTISHHITGRQMRMVLDVSRALAIPTDLDQLLLRIAEMSCELLGCERASIFLANKSKSELWTKVALKSETIHLPSSAGIVGHAFTRNQVVCVHDPYADERFYPSEDLHTGYVTRNLLAAPMQGLDGKPIGAIECMNKRDVPFGDADLALIEMLADQVGVAVQRHQLQVEAVRAATMRREMDLARRAQEKLIPKTAPPIPGLMAVGWTLPASATGGDCFDLWRLSDGRLGVLLADASGHGLGPAMIVSQARCLIRAITDLNPDPHFVLNRVNDRLLDDLEWGQFVTAFLGFLTPDGVLTWSSAGHGPVMVRSSPRGSLTVLDPLVQPLGIAIWENETSPPPMKLEPGGSLLMVSDGIFESTNASNELFGIERMVATLDGCQNSPPGDMLACLRDSVRQWQGEREPMDDETIVIVQRESVAAPTIGA